LQPRGARAPPGIFRAKHAVKQIIEQREQHFAAKPDEPSNDAERVTAQSFHPLISNAAGAAVNS
jgi:hypothetical protein